MDGANGPAVVSTTTITPAQTSKKWKWLGYGSVIVLIISLIISNIVQLSDKNKNKECPTSSPTQTPTEKSPKEMLIKDGRIVGRL